MTFGDWRILCCGGCPCPCRILGFLASLPLDFTSGPCDKQKCLQTLPNVPWVQKSPPVENHCTNDFFFKRRCIFFFLNDLEDIKISHAWTIVWETDLEVFLVFMSSIPSYRIINQWLNSLHFRICQRCSYLSSLRKCSRATECGADTHVYESHHRIVWYPCLSLWMPWTSTERLDSCYKNWILHTHVHRDMHTVGMFCERCRCVPCST